VNGLVSLVHIRQSSFSTLSSGKNGGALYFENCFDILIENSTFILCVALYNDTEPDGSSDSESGGGSDSESGGSSDTESGGNSDSESGGSSDTEPGGGSDTKPEGNGGAIYFGVNTSFSLVEVNFENCSAVYGGAIFTLSEFNRLIRNVTFKLNNVSSGGNGNDILDNSTNSMLLYSKYTVINSVTSSEIISETWNFFLLHYNLSYDCILSSTSCVPAHVYVVENSSDSSLCGAFSSQCASLTQAVWNLQNLHDGNEPLKLMVGQGEYNNTAVTVASVTLTILGENTPVLSLFHRENGESLFFRIVFFLSLTLFVLFRRVT
jgi:hypothetical protein